MKKSKMNLCYLNNEDQYRYDGINNKVVIMNKDKVVTNYMEVSEFKTFLESEIKSNERNEGRVAITGFKILNSKIA